MAWNDGLEGQALAIASSNERRIRVVAGPGAGKTFTLMRKIARLLEGGVSPDRILLVTFTRTAAHDLRKELMNLGVQGAEQVKAGTLHSFCFRILVRDSVLEITGRTPRPLFNFETEFVIKDLQKQTSLGKKQIQKKIKAFEAAWARLQSDTPGWPSDPNDKAFQSALTGYLIFHKAMLIGEVIPEALRYLRNNPRAEERTQYHHVFVDEYQDLNRAEQELINITSTDASFMVIGDEDQSIYELFRNAHPEGIRTFNQQHSGTVDYPLPERRRCPVEIVRAADVFIQNNLNREVRRLIPRASNPTGIIHSIQWSNFYDEQIGILQFIMKKIKDGVNPGQILVMCPRREIGYSIRDGCIANSIEAHSFFSEELFEEEEAQKSMTLLNLLVNKYDRIALRCWVGFESSTANVTGYQRILKHCIKARQEPFDVITLLSEGKLSIPYTNHIVSRFNELIEAFKKFEEKETKDTVAELFPKDKQWAFPFLDLLSELDEESSIEDVKTEIYNDVINPEMPMDVEYVRIMSIHKSKGLTSDISIICGVIEGLIPRVDRELHGYEAQRSLEEQRRLFYVGITRPRQELVISSVVSIPKTLAYSLNMNVPYTPSLDTRAIASSFLGQLGENFPDPIAGEAWKY